VVDKARRVEQALGIDLERCKMVEQLRRHCPELERYYFAAMLCSDKDKFSDIYAKLMKIADKKDPQSNEVDVKAMLKELRKGLDF